ncbi:WxL protein peptidoglycan domain-containing protein [Solwaraspora sp. WMMB335]|uniref:WxL protein peptidoglycan domain-containing protein n=1 Tax=Solwaraspora sp. WMMB335 TaxID=3404118 RepID=UPI003B928981
MPQPNPPRRSSVRRCALATAFAAAIAAWVPVAALFGAPAAAQPAGPSPAAARSDDAVTWAVQPSGPDGPTGRNYFVYDLVPGAEITDYVGISNLGDQDRTFTVYGTDGFLTDDGAFALLPADQPATGVGAWVHFEQREYVVPAGERLDVPFRLAVPANATPGDHAGGVIGSIAQVRTDATGQQVNVDQRVAARIYLRVDGPVVPAIDVEAMRIEYDNPINPLGGGTATVTYRVRNTGNIRIGGTGAVLLDGPFGWRLARTDPVDLPELLPGSTFTVTEQITDVPPVLWLTATVDLAPMTVDEALPPVTRTAGTWAPPWLLLAAIAVLAGWLAVRRWRARQRRTAPAGAASVDPAGDASADPAGASTVPTDTAAVP